MKIETGMFVRLKANNSTCIRQITEICEDKRYSSYRVDKPFCNQTGLSPKKIIKASRNIIDLIEERDYVNGSIVNSAEYSEYSYCGNEDWELRKGLHLECGDEEGRIIYEESDIETILTHEEFERRAYKVCQKKN